MTTINELKYLSERRLEAIKVLNENEIYDIAYHDCGYVVEFGLKAVVCKQNNLTVYPESSKEYLTHVYDKLIKLANLEDELSRKRATDRQFMKNWSIATKWSVHLRYRPIGKDDKTLSSNYLRAIQTEEGGVLPWLKTHW